MGHGCKEVKSLLIFMFVSRAPLLCRGSGAKKIIRVDVI